jgi:uncharacterized protein (DUF58 family)
MPSTPRLWNALTWPVRTLLRLTRDGLLFTLLALTCAVAAGRADRLANIPLLLCLTLFSLLAAALILGGRCVRRLRLARRCPERTFAGEPVTVTLTVANPALLPATGLLIVERLRSLTDTPRESAAAGESRRLLPSPTPGPAGDGETFATVVAGRDRERAQYLLLLRRRGLYRFRRTRLATVFPFGFWRTQSEKSLPGRVVVYPRLGEIDPALFAEVEQALARLRRVRPSREELEFRGLREYRHGDHPKWIHWRSSARHAQLMVKEFEQPQAKRVVILLDTNLQRLGRERLPAFELAISFTATAARELLRRGCEVVSFMQPPGNSGTDRKSCLTEALLASRERRNLDALFELLAGLRPNNARTLADARAHIPREMLRQAFVLVVGLGSLRAHVDLSWLRSMDNVVRVLDARGEEFRRIFRRREAGLPSRAELEEDLGPLLGGIEEGLEEPDVAQAPSPAQERSTGVGAGATPAG